MTAKPEIELEAADLAERISKDMARLATIVKESQFVRDWYNAQEPQLEEKEDTLAEHADRWQWLSHLLRSTRTETMTQQQLYFPDYDCEMPSREGWVDVSGEGHECPTLQCKKHPDLIVWCEFLKPILRQSFHEWRFEFMDTQQSDEDADHEADPPMFKTDDWEEMTRFLDAYEAEYEARKK